MLTIVFYGSDGAAAKARARVIAANKPNTARVYDAFEWCGESDACDAVEIMPCVSAWRREAIEAAFAGKVRGDVAAAPDGLELSGYPMLQPFSSKPFITTMIHEEPAPKKRGRRKVAA